MVRTVASVPDVIDVLPVSDSLRRLAHRGTRRLYRKGTLLIQEGDAGDTIFIVLTGRLRVFSSGAHSDRQFTHGTYGAGEYVGEMGLDGGPRSASVVAMETSECAVIARSTLERFIAEEPAFAFELISKLIRRARDATLSATRMALNDVYGRLKLLLESQACVHAGGAHAVCEKLTHIEWAERLGCTREMVGRILRELEKGGYIEAVPKGLALRRPLPARW